MLPKSSHRRIVSPIVCFSVWSTKRGFPGLYLNVFRPVGASADIKLPIVVWIYGSGFSTGNASLFEATTLASRSVQLGSPVIYVSFNYRVNGFGLFGDKEVKEAGVANLSIHDRE